MDPSPSLSGGSYDRRAAVFDAMVGSRAYNRIAWGASPDDYRSFAAHAVASAEGPLVEIAAGTAAMTLDAHVAGRRRTVITDLSRGMVDHARRRAEDAVPALTTHLEFAVADAFDLGGVDALHGVEGQVETVLGLGILHMVPDPAALVDALRPWCAPGATLWLSGLVAERPLSRAYLRGLHRAGEVVRPRTLAQVGEAFTDEVHLSRRGAMAYAVVRIP